MKIINGHTYECYWQGRIVFYVDFNPYYSSEDAAKAIGLTIDEFKKIW